VDEPGIRSGALIDILERYGRAVKAVDPRVQIYTDPYRGFTVVDYERLRDVLDIVQPTQYYVVLSENTDRVDYLQTVDHTRWIYEARADVKDEVTPEYYWCQVWTAWRLGFTGVGYWTYCTTGYDLWDAQADYVMVYMGANGPVPSARWQAIRIGIEDYARLARLRDAIATAPGDRAEHAKRRLGEVVAEAEAARWDPGVMARIRREITHLAMEL
jgi:hypothetical protein